MLDIALSTAPINSDKEYSSGNATDRAIVRWVRVFKALPPAERRAHLFRCRVAGYPSAAVAFNRPLRPHSTGAASVDGAFAVSAEDLFALGYGPIPETGAQRIPFKGWTTFYPDISRTPEEIRKLVRKYRDASLGVAMGYNGLVGVDIDTDDGKAIGAITGALPASLVAKRGSKGRTLFFRFVGDIDEMCNRLFFGKKADDSKADAPFCEILWLGRKTTIPPSAHAKIGRPYEWLDPKHTLFNTRVEDLPVITMADIEALETALEPRLYVPPPPVEETSKVFDRVPTDLEEKRFRGVSQSILNRLSMELMGKAAGRNIALYSASRVIGKYASRGYIDESEVFEAFASACNHNGLEKDSGRKGVRATIRNGLKKGAGDPLCELRDRPKPGSRNGTGNGSNGAGSAEPGDDAGTDQPPKQDRKPHWETYKDSRGITKKVLGETNARTALGLLGVTLHFNEFSHELLIRGLDGYGPRLDDAAFSALYVKLWSLYKLKYPKQDLHSLLSTFCHEGRFHPVLDYLDKLDKWNETQTPRLDTWLHVYLGAENTVLNAFIGRAMLVAAVRRVRHPGCKFDYLPILEGPQGIMKSTAIQALCPEVPWFLDGFKLSTATKEVMELTSGKWIIEISELVGRKMDHNAVKTLLSKQRDKARMAYGHYSEERDRQFIFIGSTNDEEYLVDPTGNRRYWPVKCGKIDIEALKRDRDLLWAEAVYWEAKGERTYPPAELLDALTTEQDARQESDEWEPLIRRKLIAIKDACEGVGGKVRTTFSEVASALKIETANLDREKQERVRRCMKHIGWDFAKRADGKKKMLHGAPIWEPVKQDWGLDDDQTITIEGKKENREAEIPGKSGKIPVESETQHQGSFHRTRYENIDDFEKSGPKKG